MLALCACSLYANTGGSSAVGSAVRGVRVGLGSDHRRSVVPHGSPPGHRAPPHILSNSCPSFARRFGHVHNRPPNQRTPRHPRTSRARPDLMDVLASLFAQRPDWQHCVSISHFYRRKTPWVKHLDLRLRYRRASSLDALLKRSSRAATHTPPSYRSGPEACKGGAAPFGNPRQGAGPRPPPPGHPGQSHFSAQRAHWSR